MEKEKIDKITKIANAIKDIAIEAGKILGNLAENMNADDKNQNEQNKQTENKQ